MRRLARCSALYLLGLAAASSVPAAADWPPSFELREDLRRADISQHAAYLEDPTRDLSFADIRSEEWSQRFQPAPGGRLNFGYSASAWWLRIELVNPAPTADEWLLEIGSAQVDRIEVYLSESDALPTLLGDSLRLDQRVLPIRQPTLPIFVPASSRLVVWARAETTSVVALRVLISSRRQFAARLHTDQLLDGLTLGLLAGVLLYNLLILVFVRDWSYFYFVAQTLASIAYTASVAGYGSWLWPGSGRWQAVAVPFFIIAIGIFAVQFARHFLATRTAIPRFDRALQGFWSAMVLSIPLLFVLPPHRAGQLSMIVALVFLPLLIITATLRFRTASLAMRIYIVGLGLFLASAAVGALASLGFGLSLFAALELTRAGFLGERLLASLALASRIRELEREADLATAALEERDHQRELLIRELEAKNAELERFTYTVSHDLKSPLVTISGFVGRLIKDLQQGDRDRAIEDLERVRLAAERMRRILDDVLDLSRVGHVTNDPEELPWREIVTEALELVEHALGMRQIEVVVQDDLPIVAADRTRMVEVMVNLLENAIKFMGDQSSPRIEIGSRRDQDKMVLFVRDNGIGIEPIYQDRIFELFTQLSPNGEGSGVGLALVKRIVEFHSGRIWVESAGHGHGTTFAFTLGTSEAGYPQPAQRVEAGLRSSTGSV